MGFVPVIFAAYSLERMLPFKHTPSINTAPRQLDSLASVIFRLGNISKETPAGGDFFGGFDFPV